MRGEGVLTANAGIIRGPESWTYLYIVFGFALSIEGTIIQMWTPLLFPYNLIFYALVAAVTFWLVILNGRFQTVLFSWKGSYESKAR